MRNNYLYYKLAVVAFTAFAFASCSKDNSINNTTVIATPYSLYFCDSAGSLWNTNDGIYFKESIFPADGVPSLAIATADTNLIWIKSGVPVGKITAHISTNQGKNFNPTYVPLNPNCLDQTLVLYARDQKRLYIATANGIQNGVKYNDSSGKVNDWVDDIQMPVVGGTLITSFTQLKNNTLVAFDWTNHNLFTKANQAAPWVQAVPVTGLPAGGQFSISHIVNTIVAIDRAGVNGAWYSPDLGVNWYQYTGLPNRKLYCAASPFESELLVGTDSAGIYVLQGNIFVPTNGGLTEATVVRSIVGKENIYVNGLAAQYVYIATSKGIYRSQDMGQNWVLVRPGNYFSIY